MEPIGELILETIGNTPLVRINRLNPNANVTIYAKLEGFNPLGSVKERIALSMVEGAERDGILTKDKVIVESSSGNTGIGLAMVGVMKGYKVLVTMSERASLERMQMLKLLGAEVVLTSAAGGSDEAWDKADEIARNDPARYLRLNQYTNRYNPLVHYETTGEEVWRQTEGKVDVLVVGLGTTGTIMGAGRRLREYNPALHIVAVEPQPKHQQQGLRNMETSRIPPILDWRLIDERMVVLDEDAFRTARRLCQEEGLFMGISAGTAMYAAAEVAKRLRQGTIVTLFPDRGEKYLTTDLFDNP
ncbi:MAG TPA: cysteine synthase family protein [Candidatus Tectomicrobia bacterium]|nr:cysteine synthase family protein [Candidatus Tectomicrobia bacterium]